MNPVAELPTLLTPTEVCQALRISRSTLGRMIDRGDLHAIRLGRLGAAMRIQAAELERFLDAPGSGDL
jgi:excisionase family DNA binding protein